MLLAARGQRGSTTLGASTLSVSALPSDAFLESGTEFCLKMEKATAAERAPPMPASGGGRSRFVPELHRPKSSTQRSRSPLEQERPGSGEPARDLLGGESGSAWDMLSWANGVLGRGSPPAQSRGDSTGNDGGGGDGVGGSWMAFPAGSNPSPRVFTK